MKKNGTIQYILLWTLVGIVAGVAVLFMQGKITLTDNDWGGFGSALSGSTPTSFSRAVNRTAPAVVSLQVQSLVEVPIEQQARSQLEQVFGKHLPNLTETRRHNTSGSGVMTRPRTGMVSGP